MDLKAATVWTYVLLCAVLVKPEAVYAEINYRSELELLIGTTRVSFQNIECDSHSLAEQFLDAARKGTHGKHNDFGRTAARFLTLVKNDEQKCSWYAGPVRFTARDIIAVEHNLDLRDILFHQYTTLIMFRALVENERGELDEKFLIDVARTPLYLRPKDKHGKPLKEINE